jgi:GxxExxY protein
MHRENIERLATLVIDSGFKLHQTFGPGLLESVYELIMADSLSAQGLKVERQKAIDIEYEGRTLREGFRLDLLVEDQLIIEVKSVEKLSGLHGKQLLTYLRLTKLPLGLLMNFNTELFGEGVRRVPNNYYGEWRKSDPK